jgi:hypothetical protein
MVACVKLIFAYLLFVSYVPFPTEALIGIFTIVFGTGPAALNIWITPFVNYLISYMVKYVQIFHFPSIMQLYRTNPIALAE